MAVQVIHSTRNEANSSSGKGGWVIGHMFPEGDHRHSTAVEIKEWEHPSGEQYPIKRFTGGWEYWNVSYGSLLVELFVEVDGELQLQRTFIMRPGDTIFLSSGPWKRVKTVEGDVSGGTTIREGSSPNLNEIWNGPAPITDRPSTH